MPKYNRLSEYERERISKMLAAVNVLKYQKKLSYQEVNRIEKELEPYLRNKMS